MTADGGNRSGVLQHPGPTTSSDQTEPPAPSGAIAATRGSRNGALDGLRGLAVIAVMAYHVVPDPFTGGWLGVDIFFVLSGFLIASMLLREQNRKNSIDYKRFLIRRARRLIPGLFLMLLAILAAAYVFETAGRRKQVAIDVLSSGLQVSNWRLILANESYFAKVSVPSPIRHTWSLGVQEQFYFIFPLILMLLFMFARNWKTMLLVFAAFAGLSFWRMLSLYVPETDPSRVYFGTDTRLFELLIGVIGAIILHRRAAIARVRGLNNARAWTRGTEQFLGFAGLFSLALIVYWMFTVNEFSPWLFRGGLAVVCGLTMLVILAATSPQENIMTRLLANKPLMKAGDLSYSLYIWHWPIIIYLTPAMPTSSELTRQLWAVGLTIGVSWLSYTFVENPIHKRGLRGLSLRRPMFGVALGALSIPLIAGGAFALANTQGNTGNRNLILQLPADPNYGREPANLTPGTVKHNVVLVGASTAVGLDKRGESKKTPDIVLRTHANVGCAPWDRQEVNRGELRTEDEACWPFRDRLPQTIERLNDPTVILFLQTRMFTDYLVDGEEVAPPSATWDRTVEGVLDDVRAVAMNAGAADFAIINMPCHDRLSFGTDDAVTRSNDFEMVAHLNEVVSGWAQRNDATIFDKYSLLCPGDTYYDSINSVPLYDDGLHYSKESAPLIWQWIADQVRQMHADKE